MILTRRDSVWGECVSAYCAAVGWLPGVPPRRWRAFSVRAPPREGYHQLFFLKAQKNYIDRLWNGKYCYDMEGDDRDSVQADQLVRQ